MTDKDTGAEHGNGATDDKDDKKSGIDLKDYVPKTQLAAALKSQDEKHEREMADLRAKLDKKDETSADDKPFTRKELKAMVENEDITQDQADELWDKQLTNQVLAKAGTVARDAVNSSTRDNNIANDIDRYKAADPDLAVEGSEIREKIKAEFKELVKLGDSPKSLATELKALRIVCGPIDAFEAAKSGKPVHEHDEQDAGNDEGGGGKKHADFKASLNPRLRAHYEKQIGQGLYKNWDEVKAEMEGYKKKVA